MSGEEKSNQNSEVSQENQTQELNENENDLEMEMMDDTQRIEDETQLKKEEREKRIAEKLRSTKEKISLDTGLFLLHEETRYTRELSKKMQFFFIIQINTVVFLILLSLILAIYTSFTVAIVFFVVSALIFVYLESKDEEILKILMIRLSMLANLKYSKKYYS